MGFDHRLNLEVTANDGVTLEQVQQAFLPLTNYLGGYPKSELSFDEKAGSICFNSEGTVSHGFDKLVQETANNLGGLVATAGYFTLFDDSTGARDEQERLFAVGTPEMIKAMQAHEAREAAIAALQKHAGLGREAAMVIVDQAGKSVGQEKALAVGEAVALDSNLDVDGVFSVPSKKGGLVTVDVGMLSEVARRFDTVCNLACRLCNQLEDSPDKAAREFDTEEMSHHAISAYSTEIRQEFRDLVADLGQCVGSPQVGMALSNANRAAFGAAAVTGFSAATGLEVATEGLQTVVGDLTANLMHLCAANGIDFEDVLRVASIHFEAEVGEEEELKTVAIREIAEVAHEKSFVEYASANPVDRVCSGKVMGVNAFYTALSLGRSALVCPNEVLDRVPVKGESVSIDFKGGVGRVSSPERDKGKGVGRG